MLADGVCLGTEEHAGGASETHQQGTVAGGNSLSKATHWFTRMAPVTVLGQCSFAVQRREVLTPATTWVEIENIMFRWEASPQRPHIIQFCSYEGPRTKSREKWISGCLGLKGREVRGRGVVQDVSERVEVSLEVMEMF